MGTTASASSPVHRLFCLRALVFKPPFQPHAHTPHPLTPLGGFLKRTLFSLAPDHHVLGLGVAVNTLAQYCSEGPSSTPH